MNAKIVLLPGDGAGPEVMEQARAVLEAVGGRFGHRFEFAEHAIGGQAMDLFGTPLPKETLLACGQAQGVLVGAVGGRKWESHSSGAAPEQGLSRLKQSLELFAEVRPIRVYPELLAAARLRRDRFSAMDVLVVRDVNYFERLQTHNDPELKLVPKREQEVRRVFDLAFRLAQERWGLVTAIHGEVPFGNIAEEDALNHSPLWKRIGEQVAKTFPTAKLEHQHVDFAAMRLLSKPTAFDVVVAEATLGRMMLDQAALFGASLGLLPSAWLGEGTLGIYEPVHGPLPDLTGKGMANPIGAILSSAMLLRHSLGLPDEAHAIEGAVAAAIAQGGRTVDMGGIPQFSTREMGEAICLNLEQDVGTDLARLLGHWG